jgi:hypothetical protein
MARKLARGPSAPEPTRAHSDVIQWPLRNIPDAHATSLAGGPHPSSLSRYPMAAPQYPRRPCNVTRWGTPPKLTQSLSDGRPSISPPLI